MCAATHRGCGGRSGRYAGIVPAVCRRDPRARGRRSGTAAIRAALSDPTSRCCAPCSGDRGLARRLLHRSLSRHPVLVFGRVALAHVDATFANAVTGSSYGWCESPCGNCDGVAIQLRWRETAREAMRTPRVIAIASGGHTHVGCGEGPDGPSSGQRQIRTKTHALSRAHGRATRGDHGSAPALVAVAASSSSTCTMRR